MSIHHDVVVVGTGFAGLAMAIKLKAAGERGLAAVDVRRDVHDDTLEKAAER